MEDLEGEGLVKESNDSECGFVVRWRWTKVLPAPFLLTLLW
jgi:hypothetical protein